MKLIGIGDGSYTNKKGEHKEGYRFYFVGQRDGVAGQVCEAAWVRRDVGNEFLQQFPSTDVALGQQVQIFYNRFGSVETLFPLQALAAKSK